MRTLFFGTPEFAVPTLKAMVESGYRPDWVISQPSRPVGRKRQLTDPPVVAYAHSVDLPVLQPEKVKAQEFMDRIASPRPDVAVVVAFGQIFRQPLLDLPRLGCVNVHASLLPSYRGAAPIQASIAAGDTETGVTTMLMERGLDSGPMLLQATLPIEPHETTSELFPRLAELGAQTLLRTLQGLEEGTLEARQQDHDAATYAPRLTKDDSLVDWRWTAQEIYDRWRALTPWPGLGTALGTRRVKILACRPADSLAAEALSSPVEPGTLLGIQQELLAVQCGGGTILLIERLQAAGKKAVDATDFANGERLQGGEGFVSREALITVADPR